MNRNQYLLIIGASVIISIVANTALGLIAYSFLPGNRVGIRP